MIKQNDSYSYINTVKKDDITEIVLIIEKFSEKQIFFRFFCFFFFFLGGGDLRDFLPLNSKLYCRHD